ncbi:MAG: deoxyguanosinetriphosphate triphosphohydrolase [Armatimonadota bacterium]
MLVTVKKQIEWEKAWLAPYAEKPEASRGRRYPEPDHPFRTPFGRDRDRVIHSRAFRRLEAKTQVFIKGPGEPYRTRLTHTLEVAQIARSVARILGLNEDLTEAIALAHDLGHPPFGHAGERALNDLLAEDGGFNHNSQSLRVVEVLERKYAKFPGLNLTWEVREGLAKHGPRDGCPPEFLELPQPSLEAQVVDAADEIAYTNHDVDDGLASGLISLQELSQIDLWQEAWDRVQFQYPDAPEQVLIAETVRHLIDAQVTDLAQSTAARVDELGARSADEIRAHPHPLAAFGGTMAARNSELRDFLYARLYRHPQVLEAVEEAAGKLRDLFAAFQDGRARIPDCPNHPPSARQIADHLASMTDGEAAALWSALV